MKIYNVFFLKQVLRFEVGITILLAGEDSIFNRFSIYRDFKKRDNKKT